MEKERAKRVRVYKVLNAVKAHAIQVREQKVKMRRGEGEILYYYCIKLRTSLSRTPGNEFRTHEYIRSSWGQ